MSNNCDINDAKKVTSLDPRDVIKIVGGKNIEVVENKQIDSTTFTINYKAYVAPNITTGSSVPVAKVGTTVPEVTLSGAIVPGSDEITSRLMTPDKGLDLEISFTYQETDVLGTTIGVYPRFSGNPTTISVTDVTGFSMTKQLGIDFRHLFYVGFSTKPSLTEGEIKTIVKADSGEDLLTSVFSKYRSFYYKNDNIPGMSLPVYLYWIIPTYSPQINGATEGPIPVPITNLGTITITEVVGYPQSYSIFRTGTKSVFKGAVLGVEPITLL